MDSAFDSRRLETFRVVAEEGRVSAAARRLNLSQPAVTAQVRQLEEACGQPLFERAARGMLLTAAGRSLLEHARALKVLLENAEAAVSTHTEAAGELVLGSSTTTVASVLPPLIAGFLAQNPRVGVRVEVGNTAEVLERVRSTRLALGLVEGHGRASGIRLEHFLEDELVPVIARAEPRELAGLKRVEDLERVRILWRERGSGTRAVVERALRQAGSSRRMRVGDLDLGDNEAILHAAALGLGLGFLSRWTVGDAVAAGRVQVVKLQGLSVPRAFSWVLPGGDPRGLAGRFLSYARKNPPPMPR